MSNIVKSQIRLPQGIYEDAKKLASEKGLSLNQFIVDAIHETTMKRACSPLKVKQALELITFALEQNNHV